MHDQDALPIPLILAAALGIAGCGRLELASAETDGAGGPPTHPEPNEPRPSCRGASLRCGADQDDCCEELLVTAGHFRVADRIESPALETFVSSFYLDKYEVTVARFARFLAEYDAWRAAGNPKRDAGLVHGRPGTGWESRWLNGLPRNAAEFEELVSTCYTAYFSTLASPEGREDLPINCVSWHEAFAFCLWDEARLPTEAEWLHAAVGGRDGRVYPWGSSPPPSPEYAVYENCTQTPEGGLCTWSDIPSVGSRPLGAGRWHHHDLAGSMSEWNADGGGVPPYGGANPHNVDDETGRVVRGGSWMDPANHLHVQMRMLIDPGTRNHIWGFRCAREDYGGDL